jgi:DNA adenine methylase
MKYVLRPYSKSADFVKSPFRYPGGKFYALKHILPFISAVKHDEYREPFVGGGSVFFGKSKVQHNWLNDLEVELANVYSLLTKELNAEKLAQRTDIEIASKDRHKEMVGWEPSSKLDRAFKTFYLNRTSYSGIIHKPAWGYKDGKSSPPPNWRRFLLSASKKLNQVKVTNKDFEEVVNAPKVGKTVLMYLDPPYYHADQKRAYVKSFKLEDHNRLSEVLKHTSHKFCLSYDDCDEIRELYKWANIHTRSWLYNTANINGSQRMIGDELIITNYELEMNGAPMLELFSSEAFKS